MKIGLFSPLRSPVCTPDYLSRFGPGCDERGIHSIWLGEHVVTFPRYESTYPGSADGVFRFPEKSGLMDMVSSLAYLAAVTENVRLGTGICILPQNNPVYAAKEYANVDFLSKGRLDFGVGVGWSWEEFEACGAPFERRGARCDEYLDVIKTLWYDDVSSYQGEFYRLPECFLYPKPVQEPVPITVGGHSKGALRRAARYGAKWYGIGLTPEQTKAELVRIDEALAEEGRTRDDLWIIMGSVSDRIDPTVVEEYAEAGVDEVLIPFLRHGEKHLDANLDDIVPYLEIAASL